MVGLDGQVEPQSTAAHAAAESDSSLEGLYRRYAGWLQAALHRLYGSSLNSSAEDLVQETYLRAARIHADGPISHPQALLLRIASRLAIDETRRHRRRDADLAPSSDGVDLAASPETEFLLKQVILSLPPREREVFALSRFAGLTYPEIAAHLGVSVKVVEWRMSRAIARCAAHFDR